MRNADRRSGTRRPPCVTHGMAAGEPGDRKRSCRGSGGGTLEKGPHGHLAGVPTSPRSQRTRASRRGRHRKARARSPSIKTACPTAFSTTESPVPGAPLIRGGPEEPCRRDFHAPKMSRRRSGSSVVAIAAGPAPSSAVSDADPPTNVMNSRGVLIDIGNNAAVIVGLGYQTALTGAGNSACCWMLRARCSAVTVKGKARGCIVRRPRPLVD